MINRWELDEYGFPIDTREAEEVWEQDRGEALNPMHPSHDWLVEIGAIPPDPPPDPPPAIDEGGGDEGGGGGGGSSSGGGGGGSRSGGGNLGAFAPPPNQIGWMPTLNLPTWTPPAPFQAPDPFAYAPMTPYPDYQKPADYVPGTFVYGDYQKPADYVPGEFSYGDYVKPADYVPGTFSAPTLAEARQEPGFQFALEEGRRQMEASAAAKGIGRTGGTVKRLIGYGQEMADTNYGNVFNRSLGTFNTNEGNRAGVYGTNAALGLNAYTANRGNAYDNFALNEGNRAGAYQANLAAGLAGYNTNRGNAFDNFTTNEGNRAGAYGTNAALGFGAWDANRANAANTFATNYGVAKDTYDYGYKSLMDEYTSLYGTSKQKHDYDTAEAVGEFAPKKDEAEITHAQAFAEWLAKMGIAQNIFNEGSD